MPQILDGIRVRDEILGELKARVARLSAARRPPGLAALLAGSNPA
ncbi:MAG: bifunctional methylenetetrahydrofolate dehydrogenase/methenyltetrahydrofolate cyclohydrolase, partial [Acidobacteria bacterium]|nr:bifunctional methylenetetrahydrofolate dehydrogenase/methenyltetrahydrofolate cyclohydrolase [Acidobacteriota bacterium]